jgi:DNA-binding MarR family transcriptional regulator
LQVELFKREPFTSAEQEAYLSLARTHAVLSGQFDSLFKAHGLTQSGYNALRILRGAGPGGRKCQELGEHLVTKVPDVTRLIDRLEDAGLASRERSTGDKRVIFVRITPKGLALLEELEQPVARLHRAQFGGVGGENLRVLIDALLEARDRARGLSVLADGPEPAGGAKHGSAQ